MRQNRNAAGSANSGAANRRNGHANGRWSGINTDPFYAPAFIRPLQNSDFRAAMHAVLRRYCLRYIAHGDFSQYRAAYTRLIRSLPHRSINREFLGRYIHSVTRGFYRDHPLSNEEAIMLRDNGQKEEDWNQPVLYIDPMEPPEYVLEYPFPAPREGEEHPLNDRLETFLSQEEERARERIIEGESDEEDEDEGEAIEGGEESDEEDNINNINNQRGVMNENGVELGRIPQVILNRGIIFEQLPQENPQIPQEQNPQIPLEEEDRNVYRGELHLANEFAPGFDYNPPEEGEEASERLQIFLNNLSMRQKNWGECIICMEEGEDFIELPCGHFFHLKCAGEALKFQKKIVPNADKIWGSSSILSKSKKIFLKSLGNSKKKFFRKKKRKRRKRRRNRKKNKKIRKRNRRIKKRKR